MKDRMFVVPGSFVPYNDTVTLLTYKRLRNLELDMDVFCFAGKQDLSLVEELENDEKYKRFTITTTSSLDWAVPRYHPLRLPVSLFLMIKYVIDSMREFKKKEYKYLYSSIVPGISHIAGFFIKKNNPDVKWYASFSDPFKGSPYKKTDLKDRSIIYRIMFKVGSFFLYNNIFEELAINNADKLIFICEEQRDFTLKQYNNYEELKEKTIIYPLTYIPEWKMYKDLLETVQTDNKPKIAVHLGRLYGLRKIDSFIEALKELKMEDDNLSDKIVFHQYSEIQPNDIEKIRKYRLEDVFVLHDRITYKESVDIMKHADVLVLFDSLMTDQPVQPYLPSKIVEYLMLRKPILGVCDKNSPSYRILSEYGYKTVGSDKEAIKANIISIINSKRKINYSFAELNNDNYDKLIIG